MGRDRSNRTRRCRRIRFRRNRPPPSPSPAGETHRCPDAPASPRSRGDRRPPRKKAEQERRRFPSSALHGRRVCSSALPRTDKVSQVFFNQGGGFITACKRSEEHTYELQALMRI